MSETWTRPSSRDWRNWPVPAKLQLLRRIEEVKRQRLAPTGLSAGPDPLTPGFRRWLSLVSPRWQWNWRHLLHIQEQLEGVTTGATRRLMIFCPPRHGKSEQATIRYPVWRL